MKKKNNNNNNLKGFSRRHTDTFLWNDTNAPIERTIKDLKSEILYDE